MTGSWQPVDAPRISPNPWSVTRSWCGRLPSGGWPTSSRTALRLPHGCTLPPRTWLCKACSLVTSTGLPGDQDLLLDGTRRLADAQARFGPAVNGHMPEHLVSVISDRAEISELSASLVNTARQDWMTLENLATEMPLTDDFGQPPLSAPAGSCGAGRSMRRR